jgi:ATP-binding cassette, subfamily B, bacterial
MNNRTNNMTDYSLQKNIEAKNSGVIVAMGKLFPLMRDDKGKIILAMLAAFLNAGLNLTTPVLIGHAIDKYLPTRNYHGILVYSGIILGIYIAAVISQYIQTLVMGTVGQNMLFNLRASVFAKIQELPVAFFNQNKAGDLISRINNDTDKLNQFFSQSLIQFVANIVTIFGAAIFVLFINWHLGIMALGPAILLLIFTRLLSSWIKSRNATSLKNVGLLSGEISESIDNFKVVVAFNRRDYFRKMFAEANDRNYDSAISAGVANNTLTPAYGLAASLAQLSVIAFGLHLISQGSFTLGLLISFLSYIQRLYDPLRQVAAIWTSFQTALAGWDRIHAILVLDTDLVTIPGEVVASDASLLSFKDVSFKYTDGKEVLKNVNLSLLPGKTYALVGPTGGGKTTTASLMARLYDPTSGLITLGGKDIRSYAPEERAKKIGFILQEPFLFSGTIRDNITYGNEKYKNLSNKELEKLIKDDGLESLLSRFDEGLDTKVLAVGGALSLGQKQLIAFIRAVLRHPDLLILDEATANIDTVTEALLQDILKKLPSTTTKVIIAHRLNTIENADEIFFVNGSEITAAGSMEHAVDMLLHGKRES